jgi:hypothetical protein
MQRVSEPVFWLAASRSRLGLDQRRTLGIGWESAAFKSCRNKPTSDGVSIRGVFEVASFRPGKAVEAKPFSQSTFEISLGMRGREPLSPLTNKFTSERRSRSTRRLTWGSAALAPPVFSAGYCKCLSPNNSSACSTMRRDFTTTTRGPRRRDENRSIHVATRK